MPKTKVAPAKNRTSVFLSPPVAAWLAWQAQTEGINRDGIIEKALREYHERYKKKNPKTPDID